MFLIARPAGSRVDWPLLPALLGGQKHLKNALGWQALPKMDTPLSLDAKISGNQGRSWGDRKSGALLLLL